MDWIAISDLSGGRNGADSPIDPNFSMKQCVEAFNVDFSQFGALARKRAGSVAITTAGGTAFTTVCQLFRFVPGDDEHLAELFGVDVSGLMKRLAPPGTAWANVTLDDPITNPLAMSAVTFNGKLYIAYDSTVDRLHVYDPTLAVPRVRRTGFAVPGAPTVANFGSGLYAAEPHRYRIRWYQSPTASGGAFSMTKSGTGPGPVSRVSEPGPSSAVFTPSGTGLGATITRPGLPGEGETHWGVEVSLDGILWYVLAAPNGDALSADGIPVATTTYNDSVVTSTYSTYPLSDELGTNTNIPSVKFLLTDNNRMIMAGNWENGLSSRVYYTPVLGSGLGDAERLNDLVDVDPFTDLNEKDGGAITGLGGPLPGGVIFAFKQRQIWRGTPTGVDEEPYSWRCQSRVVGCVAHASIVLGEDHEGKAALYFMSLTGPYRIGNNSLEYMGRDIEDAWLGNWDVGLSPNQNAPVQCHGVWHADKHIVYWFISFGTSNYPNHLFTLDVRHMITRDQFGPRGGWVRNTTGTALRLCSVMFSNTLGAVMSSDLKPYVGGDVTRVAKFDDDTATTDEGTAFQAFVKTRSLLSVEQLGSAVGVRETLLFASKLAGTTITQTLDADFGVETQVSTVDLTGVGTEVSTITRKFEGSSDSDMGVVQVQIGDAAPAAPRWQLIALLVPVTTERTK